MQQLGSVMILLAMATVGYGQKASLLPEPGWKISHYQGSCYHDTIIHAIWLYIDPNQALKKYQHDTSFIVLEVTAVNKSPIDVYFYGQDNKLNAPVIQEKYVIDTVTFDPNKKNWGAYPRKLDKSLAFSDQDYAKDPHKYLSVSKKGELLVQIPKNTRKKLLLTVPKREGDYRIEAIVEFNKELYAYDCEGEKVTWEQFRVIESNKIELKEQQK
jgi:hypothetical protein